MITIVKPTHTLYPQAIHRTASVSRAGPSELKTVAESFIVSPIFSGTFQRMDAATLTLIVLLADGTRREGHMGFKTMTACESMIPKARKRAARDFRVVSVTCEKTPKPFRIAR